MINKRGSFMNEWTIILYITIACIAFLNIYKSEVTWTKRTLEDEVIISEVNILSKGIIIYASDTEVIILSEGDNNILFFDANGHYLYSYSLSSYSDISINYNSQTHSVVGYYYRTQVGFIVDKDGVINFNNTLEPQIDSPLSKCYNSSDGTVYCLKKNILGQVEVGLSNGDIIQLEVNSMFDNLELLIVVGCFGLFTFKGIRKLSKNRIRKMNREEIHI